MVFTKFNRTILKNVEEDLQELEQSLIKLGWANLKWGPYWNSPSGEDKTADGLFWMRYVLRGLPPGYDGPYEDYRENALITLAPIDNRFVTTAVMIREQLDKPYSYD